MRSINFFIATCFLIAFPIFFSSGNVYAQGLPNQRPRFEKKWIQIENKKIEVEIADTEEKRSFGLMYIEKLKSDQGMLFIFDSEQPLAFWMKNTLVDLSIGYFDKNKMLVDIQDMKGQKSIVNQDLRSYPSKTQAQYALEVPKGWFTRNKIKVGNKFSFSNK